MSRNAATIHFIYYLSITFIFFEIILRCGLPLAVVPGPAAGRRPGPITTDLSDRMPTPGSWISGPLAALASRNDGPGAAHAKGRGRARDGAGFALECFAPFGSNPQGRTWRNGRRKGLKIPWGKPRAGSSPAVRTRSTKAFFPETKFLPKQISLSGLTYFGLPARNFVERSTIGQ
jgi:hypothetical protein